VKGSLAIVLAAAFAPLAAAAADASPPPMATLTMSVTPYPPPHSLVQAESAPHYGTHWAVSLDADGRVAKLETNDKALPDAIRTPLDGAIRKWQFVPGTINGQPVPTQTMLTLDVTLVPVGEDKYALRVDDARTGGDISAKNMHQIPKYPREAIRHHRQGFVVLKVDYDAKGHVLATSLHAGAPAVDDDFRIAAERAVKSWSFTPEVVGGRALAGSAIVPMCFNLIEMGGGVKTLDCQWIPPGARGGLRDGEVLAIEPAARLKTDIVGHTL
jgi:TonB family protein